MYLHHNRFRSRQMKLYSVEIDGIDHGDHPDYCDAYISYAEDEQARPLTQEEIDNIPSDVVHELVLAYIY